MWWDWRNDEEILVWTTKARNQNNMGKLENLCESKLKGGMRFYNLQAFNLTMLAKQGSTLLSNLNSPVAHIYKAKYYPHRDVLVSKLGCNPSYA